MGPIVVEWRRGYSMRPPPMVDTHPHWPLISLDSRYRGVKIPESESLSDTADRVRGDYYRGSGSSSGFRVVFFLFLSSWVDI